MTNTTTTSAAMAIDDEMTRYESCGRKRNNGAKGKTKDDECDDDDEIRKLRTSTNNGADGDADVDDGCW